MAGYTEIGSEFHKAPLESGRGVGLPCGGQFVFSGRTAIETVLKEYPAKKAALPSYCCDSMIEPFRRAGIAVCFYKVGFADGLITDVDIADDVDTLLWCNYFGFRVPMPELSGFRSRGGVIIEDVTHSFLSERVYHPQSRYLVASLRKWEPILCGGYCASADGELRFRPETPPPETFLAGKAAAMSLKEEYLKNPDPEKKARYLSMFGESNRWLAENYSGLSVDPWSGQYLMTADVQRQRLRRIENARVLYAELRGTVRFLFPEEEMDCPLFVPILLPARLRPRVRQALTDREIYCPVHWPHPNADCASELYDSELSLVCDQRYGEEDMLRVSAVLRAALT